MPERFSQVAHRVRVRRAQRLGHVGGRFDQVPVTIVFRQPAKALVWVKKKVLTPFVLNAVDLNRATQIADQLKQFTFQFATASQRNERGVLDSGVECLENPEILVRYI